MKKKNLQARVKYPIGIKLIIIITSLLLISLGTITALVSYFVSADLQITAEDNNFSINQRSAAQAESTLQTIQSNALVLLDSLGIADAGKMAEFYFDRNRDVAAIVIDNRTLINDRFFLTNEIEASLVDEFMGRSAQAMEHARNGQTDILNGAPVFGIPVLALIFPRQGQNPEAVAIIFLAESLTDAFGSSANSSVMINDAGDILIHGDHDLVMAGANMLKDPLVKLLRESREQNFQTLYTDLAGVRQFGAFRKLAIANAVVITSVEYDVVFEGITATTRRNLYLTGAVL
jgi:adenylate cyclase